MTYLLCDREVIRAKVQVLVQLAFAIQTEGYGQVDAIRNGRHGC